MSTSYTSLNLSQIYDKQGSAQGRCLPPLMSLVAGAPDREASLTEGALDLINTLLAHAAPHLLSHAAELITPSVLKLLKLSSDDGILQSCAEYLRCLHLSVSRCCADFSE